MSEFNFKWLKENKHFTAGLAIIKNLKKIFKKAQQLEKYNLSMLIINKNTYSPQIISKKKLEYAIYLLQLYGTV